MSTPNIEIPCNAANPVNFLACCGILDLLARIDAEALAWWSAKAPTTFLLSTGVGEESLLATILDTFCAPTRWHSELPAAGIEPTWLRVHFAPADRPEFDVALDWWLETAELDGSIAENTAWKMFAGQQTIETLLLREKEKKLGLVLECVRLKAAHKLPANLSTLLDVELPMTSRFGFDPRSSRNALDIGWSPNDLKVPIPTALFAELLALFGVNSFFPARTARAGYVESTRGWNAADDARSSGFTYVLWERPLPITLARRAAINSSSAATTLFSARDDSRGKYKNLTLAKTTASKP